MLPRQRAFTSNAGFDLRIDPRTARRQLNLSLGVVVLLALAIVTAALSLDTRPVSSSSYVVSIPTATHQAQYGVSAFGS